MTRHRTKFLIALPLVLLAGCASAPRPAEPLKLEAPVAFSAPKISAQAPPLPAVVRIELEPAIDGFAQLDSVFSSDKRFDLNVTDAELTEVLTLLSRAAARSLVLDPGIHQRVTASLSQVPLSQVLRTLLEGLDLGVRIDGELVRIGPRPLASAAFQLALPDASGFKKLKELARADGGGNEAAEEESNSWKAVGEALKLTLSPRGSFKLDQEGSLVLVRDTPERLNAAQRVLEQTVGTRRRQVTIEAVIAEVTLTDDMSYGIDWNAPAMRATLSDSPIVGNLASKLANITDPVVSFAIESSKLSLLLKALRSYGNLNVLSAPRVTTLNRVAARVAITEEVPYYTSDFQAIGQQAVQSVQLSFRESGIILDVTPLIAATDEVSLDLHPRITEVTGFTPSLPNLPPNPILDSREVRTSVRARSGQSVVLAGLIRRSATETRREIPGLGRLAGAGVLFRNVDQKVKRTELVLIITPLVTGEREQSAAVTDALDRADKLRQPFSPGPANHVAPKQK